MFFSRPAVVISTLFITGGLDENIGDFKDLSVSDNDKQIMEVLQSAIRSYHKLCDDLDEIEFKFSQINTTIQ